MRRHIRPLPQLLHFLAHQWQIVPTSCSCVASPSGASTLNAGAEHQLAVTPSSNQSALSQQSPSTSETLDWMLGSPCGSVPAYPRMISISLQGHLSAR
jgi:hypothetical protein